MLKRRHYVRRQLGMSLVELMVGITIGLFVVAAATILMATQLTENRRLLTETQLQQDLRATADIITRELRRAGYSAIADTSVANVTAGQPVPDPYLDLPVGNGVQGSVAYNYKRPDNAPGPFGYKLDAGVIKTNLSAAGWQELTDKNVLFVDLMTFVLNTSTDPATAKPLVLACAKDCPPPPPGQGPEWCWPTVAVRDLTITITGHSVSDPAVVRTVQSRVRLRNDLVQFNSPTGAGTFNACPT